MKTITTIISSAFCLMLMSCTTTKAIEMKELRVYNISKQGIVLHECSGMDLFGDGRNNMITRMYGDGDKAADSPREYDPDNSMTIATWGDSVNFQYPIIVKWAYQSHPKEIKEIKFDQIMNLKKGQKEIREAGSINLVFHDGAFYLIWVKNKRNLFPKEYLEILKDIKK